MFSRIVFSFKSFLTTHRNDILALSFLISFLAILSYFLLEKDMAMGVYFVRDVFSYLNNALDFAGYSSGLSSNRGLSPLIPFLTSLIFRLGYVQDYAIMIISTLFFCLSGLSIYAFLRLRFNELYSLSGAVIFSTFSINLAWASKGMLDIPALFFSILIIYFTFLAINKNSKYWLLVFPIFVLGFFTRYTIVLIIFVAFISILTVYNPLEYIKNNLKNIFSGISLGILTSVPFFLHYHLNKIPLFFLSQINVISNETASATEVIVKTNPFHYINNLPIYLSTLENPPYSIKSGAFQFFQLKWVGGEPSIISYILLAIIVIGLIIYVSKLFSKKENILIVEKKDRGFILKIFIFLVSIVGFIFTFQNISVIYSIILFSIAILSLYRLFYKSKIPFFNLDFLVFHWFMTNLIFFSSHVTKVDRYAITLTPAIVYFIVLATYMIYKQIESSKYNFSKLKKFNVFKIPRISKIFLPIALIIAVISFTAIGFSNDPTTFDNQKPENILYASSNEKIIADFLINYDENFHTKVIWADRGGDFSFFLRMNIPSVDGISSQTNFTEIMLDNNVSYFIAKGKKDNIKEDYEIIKNKGNVYLYKRVS